EPGAAAIERGALGVELRAVVGPAGDEADGRLVLLGFDDWIGRNRDGAARAGDDHATHAGGSGAVERPLRAVDVQAVELLGVLGLARDLPGRVAEAVAAPGRALDRGLIEHVAGDDLRPAEAFRLAAA